MAAGQRRTAVQPLDEPPVPVLETVEKNFARRRITAGDARLLVNWQDG